VSAGEEIENHVDADFRPVCHLGHASLTSSAIVGAEERKKNVGQIARAV
jgi:hypothetical protein